MSPANDPILLFTCDLNWTTTGAAAAHEWASVDPRAYFDWHVEFGSSAIFCQAYTFGGYAFYPTRLGPVAPGPGQQLFPRLYELGRQAGMPVWSYFCVGADLIMSNFRADWVVPGSRSSDSPYGFLAPESGWTDLLCARVREFLALYPVDWLLFDWFVYGGLKPDVELVRPAPFVEAPFAEICGRPMPDRTEEITPAEHLGYKREVLARQFHRLRDAVKETSPGTRILFNVPYWESNEAIWQGHPMLRESDGLFAECSRPEIVEWLLAIRQPGQRVMTTVLGRTEDGECDPESWRRWHKEGCDLCGYAWGAPPDFRPAPRYAADMEIVRKAFAEIRGG